MNQTDPQALHTFWESHITGWKESQLSQAAYCQTHELAVHRFYYWKRKFEGKKSPVTSGGFVPVHPVLGENHSLTVQLPNQIRIEGIASDNLHLLEVVCGILR